MSPRDKRPPRRAMRTDVPTAPKSSTTTGKPKPAPCPLEDAGGCDTTDTDADTGG